MVRDGYCYLRSICKRKRDSARKTLGKDPHPERLVSFIEKEAAACSNPVFVGVHFATFRFHISKDRSSFSKLLKPSKVPLPVRHLKTYFKTRMNSYNGWTVGSNPGTQSGVVLIDPVLVVLGAVKVSPNALNVVADWFWSHAPHHVIIKPVEGQQPSPLPVNPGGIVPPNTPDAPLENFPTIIGDIPDVGDPGPILGNPPTDAPIEHFPEIFTWLEKAIADASHWIHHVMEVLGDKFHDSFSSLHHAAGWFLDHAKELGVWFMHTYLPNLQIPTEINLHIGWLLDFGHTFISATYEVLQTTATALSWIGAVARLWAFLTQDFKERHGPEQRYNRSRRAGRLDFGNFPERLVYANQAQRQHAHPIGVDYRIRQLYLEAPLYNRGNDVENLLAAEAARQIGEVIADNQASNALEVSPLVDDEVAVRLQKIFPAFRVVTTSSASGHTVLAAIRKGFRSIALANLAYRNEDVLAIGASATEMVQINRLALNAAPRLSGRDVYRQDYAHPTLNNWHNNFSLPMTFHEILTHPRCPRQAVIWSFFSAHDIHPQSFIEDMVANGSHTAILAMHLPFPLMDDRVRTYVDPEALLRYEIVGDRLFVYHEEETAAGYSHDISTVLAWMMPLPTFKNAHVQLEVLSQVGTAVLFVLTVAPGAQELVPSMWKATEADIYILPELLDETLTVKDEREFVAIPAARFEQLIGFVTSVDPGLRKVQVIAAKVRSQMAVIKIGKFTVEKRWGVTIPQLHSLIRHALICERYTAMSVERKSDQLIHYYDRAFQRTGNFFQRMKRYHTDLWTGKLTGEPDPLRNENRGKDLWFSRSLAHCAVYFPYHRAGRYRVVQLNARASDATFGFGPRDIHTASVADQLQVAIEENVVPNIVVPRMNFDERAAEIARIRTILAERQAERDEVAALAAEQTPNEIQNPVVNAIAPPAPASPRPTTVVAAPIRSVPVTVISASSDSYGIDSETPTDVLQQIISDDEVFQASRVPLPQSPTVVAQVLPQNASLPSIAPQSVIAQPEATPAASVLNVVTTPPKEQEVQLPVSAAASVLPSPSPTSLVIAPDDSVSNCGSFAAGPSRYPGAIEESSASSSSSEASGIREPAQQKDSSTNILENLAADRTCVIAINAVSKCSPRTMDFTGSFSDLKASTHPADQEFIRRYKGLFKFSDKYPRVGAPSSGVHQILGYFARFQSSIKTVNLPNLAHQDQHPGKLTAKFIINANVAPSASKSPTENFLLQKITKYANANLTFTMDKTVRMLLVEGPAMSAKSSAVQSWLIANGHRAKVFVHSRKLKTAWEEKFARSKNLLEIATRDSVFKTNTTSIGIIDEVFLFTPVEVYLMCRILACTGVNKIIFIGDRFQGAVGGITIDHKYFYYQLNFHTSLGMPRDSHALFVKCNRLDSNWFTTTGSTVHSIFFTDSPVPKVLKSVQQYKFYSEQQPEHVKDTVGMLQGSRFENGILHANMTAKKLDWLTAQNARFSVAFTRHTGILRVQMPLAHQHLFAFQLPLVRPTFVAAPSVQSFRDHGYQRDHQDLLLTRPNLTSELRSKLDHALTLVNGPMGIDGVVSIRVPRDPTAQDRAATAVSTARMELQTIVFEKTGFSLPDPVSMDFEVAAPRYPAKLSRPGLPVQKDNVRNDLLDSHKMAAIHVSSSMFDSSKNVFDRQFSTSKAAYIRHNDVSEGFRIYQRFKACYYKKDALLLVDQDVAFQWFVSEAKRTSNLSNIVDPLGSTAATLKVDSMFKTQSKAKAKECFAATLPYGQSVLANQKIFNMHFAETQPRAYGQVTNLLRDDVIMDFGMSDEDLSFELKRLGLTGLLTSLNNYQCDVKQQDSSHTCALLCAFILILRDAGCDEDILDFYFQYCSKYWVSSTSADHSGYVAFNLGSGDPFTLLRNIIMQLCVIACRYECARTMSLIGKGDDVLASENDRIPGQLALTRGIAGVTLTEDFGAVAYHAGRFHNGDRFLVDPIRAFMKHLTRLSDEETTATILYESYISRATDYTDAEVSFLVAACQEHYPFYDGDQVVTIIDFMINLRNKDVFFAMDKVRIDMPTFYVDTKDCAVNVARALLPGRSQTFYREFRNLTYELLVEKFTSNGVRCVRHDHVSLPTPKLGVAFISPTHVTCYAPAVSFHR